jgi:hypothetical protein
MSGCFARKRCRKLTGLLRVYARRIDQELAAHAAGNASVSAEDHLAHRAITGETQEHRVARARHRRRRHSQLGPCLPREFGARGIEIERDHRMSGTYQPGEHRQPDRSSPDPTQSPTAACLSHVASPILLPRISLQSPGENKIIGNAPAPARS